MTRYISVTDTAKLVRAALKAAFPGVKFSVRSDKYAGGASIDVSWIDGPAEKDVEKITDRYRGAQFDGMQDLKTYHSTLLAGPDGKVEEVHFGADFIPTHRKLSEAYLAELRPHAEAILDGYAGTYGKPFDLNGWYEGVPCEYGVFQNGSGHNLLWWLSKHVAPSTYTPASAKR
jgi:conjugative element/phage-associated large polyvalent protein